jgi:hypothetical protein
MSSADFLKNFSRGFLGELRIGCFENDKESVVGYALESIPVKNGMMKAWQEGEQQKTKHSAESCEEDGKLKEDW